MVDIVASANRGQFRKQLDSMFGDRKRVFVDLLKWDLSVTSGRFEIDQFDDNNAVYLIISDSARNHMGSMRLLCADRPHILGNLFSYLCKQDVPADAETMEITRLCLCPRLSALERLHIRNRLISGMVDYALARGIKTLTGVVTVRFLARILMMGWRCEALGSPQVVGGSMIGAFRIDIDEATPQLLRTTGIYAPETISEYLSIEA